MNYSDLGNGIFEIIGAFMLSINLYYLWKDKELKGSHWLPVVFYTSWGFFNLWFYPSNNLWFSFLGGVLVVLVNFCWLISLWIIKNDKNNLQES